MSAILEQLEIDQTFFTQLVIIAVLFFTLSAVYFRPFLRLFEIRHQKTVADREAAERLMAQASAKFEEYRLRMVQERQAARKEFDAVIAETKKNEHEILSRAREEAKKITHEAAESIAKQRDTVKAQLEGDVESMAKVISEKLLSRKV